MNYEIDFDGEGVEYARYTSLIAAKRLARRLQRELYPRCLSVVLRLPDGSRWDTYRQDDGSYTPWVKRP